MLFSYTMLTLSDSDPIPSADICVVLFTGGSVRLIVAISIKLYSKW